MSEIAKEINKVFEQQLTFVAANAFKNLKYPRKADKITNYFAWLKRRLQL